jgi:hypothetical protein
MLCTIEVVAVLLIYFLCTSKSLVVHEAASKFHYSFRHSLEDVMALSVLRAGVLSAMYAACTPIYLYASYLLAGLCFPFILTKTVMFHYGHDAVPAAALLTITGLFCWVHVLAARCAEKASLLSFTMSEHCLPVSFLGLHL